MKRVTALTLIAVTIGSLFALSTVAWPGSAQTSATETGPTEIASCMTIDSPGHYVLTQDIVRPDPSEGPCIQILASDVTVDGNGHTIQGTHYGTGIETTDAATVRNVTVEDVTVRAHEVNVRFENVIDGRIANVTSREGDLPAGVVVQQSRRVHIHDSDLEGEGSGFPAIEVRHSQEVVVANTTFRGWSPGINMEQTNRSVVNGNVFLDVEAPIILRSGSGNTISDNTLDGELYPLYQKPSVGIMVGGSNNTVSGHTFTAGDTGIRVSGSNNTVADNHVSSSWMTQWGATAEGVNHTFVNNTLSGGHGDSRGYDLQDGGALELVGGGYEIENNTLGGVHGVYVKSSTGPVSIDDNHFTAIYQIRVAESKLCPVGEVTAHGNVFEIVTRDYIDERYGVVNEGDQVVNATNNYWGAEDGPSSPEGTIVEDPVTGTAANGSGKPVSTGVHFDPWLSQPANQSGTAG